MQLCGDKVKGLIAELLRDKKALKTKIIDICGFRISGFYTVNGVTRELIANFMYWQIIYKVKGVNLPYMAKLMPNTASSVLQKTAKSGGCKSSDPFIGD